MFTGRCNGNCIIRVPHCPWAYAGFARREATFFEFGRIACREAGCGAWLSHVLARGLGGMHPQKYF